jgi:hypothetical protein
MKVVSVISRLSFIASIWLFIFNKEYWYSMFIFLLVIFILEVIPYSPVPKKNVR